MHCVVYTAALTLLNAADTLQQRLNAHDRQAEAHATTRGPARRGSGREAARRPTATLLPLPSHFHTSPPFIKCHVKCRPPAPATCQFDSGDYRYDAVCRWTLASKLTRGAASIFDKAYVIFPVHCHGNHWVLVWVDMGRRTITCLDSLGGDHAPMLATVLRWLRDEAAHKLTGDAREQELHQFAAGAWMVRLAHETGSPRQRNGYDCGLFVCMAADCIAQCAPLLYAQSDMPIIRRRMVWALARDAAVVGTVEGPSGGERPAAAAADGAAASGSATWQGGLVDQSRPAKAMPPLPQWLISLQPTGRQSDRLSQQRQWYASYR
jgi:hypothetical protein